MWRLVLLAAPLVAEDHHGRWLRKLEADPAHACAPERLRELRELAAAGAVRADVVEEIRTPRDRTAKGARPERRQTILMDDDAGGATAFECREGGSATARPGRRRAHRGSSASQHAVSRLDDKYTKRVVGEKTLLISVICPSSSDCDSAYPPGGTGRRLGRARRDARRPTIARTSRAPPSYGT